MDIDSLQGYFQDEYDFSQQFEQAKEEVVALGPWSPSLVESVGSADEPHTNIGGQSEQGDPIFLDEDETVFFNMFFGDDVQPNEAQPVGSSSSQVDTNIGDGSEQHDQTYLDLDQSNLDQTYMDLDQSNLDQPPFAMLENGSIQTNGAEFMQSNYGQPDTNIGGQSEQDDQTFLDVDQTNLDEALFAMLENDNVVDVQTNCIVEKKRKRVAIEPAMYVNVIKTCTICSSHEVQFKHLNNNKLTQPRYKCLNCMKLFVHNPTSTRRKHPEGYKKSRDKKALPNTMAVCPNPNCGQVEFVRFSYYFQNNLSQPQYTCEACGISFPYGGQFSTNSAELQEHAHLVEANQAFTMSNTIFGPNTLPTGSSQDHLQTDEHLIFQEFLRLMEYELLQT